MRGYGIPQAMFAVESHTEDVAKIMGIPPIDFRLKNLMPQGYKDAFSKNENYYDTFRQCIEKGKAYMDYDNRVKELAKQTGRVRTGIGMATFWYNTAVWPISLESSSSRMVLNQDGSVTLQLGETEIGQGADTAFVTEWLQKFLESELMKYMLFQTRIPILHLSVQVHTLQDRLM